MQRNGVSRRVSSSFLGLLVKKIIWEQIIFIKSNPKQSGESRGVNDRGTEFRAGIRTKHVRK